MNNTLILKRGIIIFVILLSISFYKLFFVTGTITRVSGLIAAFTVIFFLVFHIIYFNVTEKSHVEKNFVVPVTLFFIAPFLSMQIAYFFHDQPYLISIYAQSPMYLYLLYFLLHRWKVDPDFLIKVVYIIGIIYLILYIAQWAIYPIKILQTRIDFTRGTVRIFFPGSFYASLTYYLLLSKTITEKFEWKNVIIVFVAFVVLAILQGTRGTLFLMVAITGLYLLTGKYIKNRFLILFLSLMVAVSIFFVFMDIFIGLFELSLEQGEEAEEDPRVLATKFFLNDFMASPLAYVFGNGESHMASPFGRRVMFYKMFHGYYQSDVGLVGAYSKYGIPLVIAYFWYVFRIMFFKLPKRLIILRFVMIGNLTSIVYGSGHYTQPVGAVGFVVIMYLIDGYLAKEQEEYKRATREKPHVEKDNPGKYYRPIPE
jgi:hypothetical protein